MPSSTTNLHPNPGRNCNEKNSDGKDKLETVRKLSWIYEGEEHHKPHKQTMEPPGQDKKKRIKNEHSIHRYKRSLRRSRPQIPLPKDIEMEVTRLLQP